jgi:hypothetical protein
MENTMEDEMNTPEYQAYLLSDEYIEVQQRAKSNESKMYLSGTDWYEIRAISGKPVPEDILTKRQEARDSITKENK